MDANPKPSVLLVEDDELLRGSLARLLDLSGFAVTSVGDGLSFYREIGRDDFDVAVIDLGLPDQGGETLVAYLRQNKSTAIVVITARDTLETRVDCYRTGADLFLGKPVDGRELVAAVGSLVVRARSAKRAAPQTEAIVWSLDAGHRTLTSPDGESLALSSKEWLLVKALATTSGFTTRAELLELLYQLDDDATQRALDTLLHRTRQKLTERFHEALIINEYGVGYRFAGTLRVREGSTR